MDLEPACRQAHALGAIEKERPDIGRFEAIGADDLFGGGVDFFRGEGRVHLQDFGTVEEALGVFGQTEDGRTAISGIGAFALKAAKTVVQTVGETVHRRLAPGHHLTIEPNESITICHRHHSLLSGPQAQS